jgi:hypothetical protein
MRITRYHREIYWTERGDIYPVQSTRARQVALPTRGLGAGAPADSGLRAAGAGRNLLGR